MPRLRLRDFRLSRGPRVLGICAENQPACAEYVNGAQRRLILAREAGDEGWWGTWAEVMFSNVSRTNPFITCPPEVARIEKINVCSCPARINNQFYEYLDFGNGRLPKVCSRSDRFFCAPTVMTRNNAVTFVDQTISPCTIRIYSTDNADQQAAKRVMVSGLNTAGDIIYTTDGNSQVQGEFITIDNPFSDSVNQFTAITGIQKDVTYGTIQIFQLDPNTGDERLLGQMQQSETVAEYRRYYLDSLPPNCCLTPSPDSALSITAIVKLELLPITVDTDYLLLHNLEAVIEECIAIRMSEMDNMESQQLAAVHHTNAIRLLNSEIAHYLGKQSPAVNFAPWGTARLERDKIGSLI